MLGLIWKDFRMNRGMLVLPAVVAAGFTLIGLVVNSRESLVFAASILPVYSSMIVPFFALNSVTLEEKNRTLAFLRSLPMNPGAIVASKFVAPFLVGLAWMGLTATAVAALGLPAGEGAFSLASAALLVCVTLPVAAVQLVVFFRSGAGAARTALLVTWFILFLGPMLLPGSKLGATSLFVMVANLKPGVSGLVAAGALVVYFACMLIAQAIFQRREL